MYTYIAGFIAEHESWFNCLWSEIDWERRPDAPRREYWTNTLQRPYTYGRGAGRRTYEAKPDHELIFHARNLIKEHHGVFLEGCFLNGYENARDWLGWHADDDPGIDHSKPIAIITLGQGRVIQFRSVLYAADVTLDKKIESVVPNPVETLMLEPGSLCLMHAGMQQTHQHRIPKADRDVGPRVSLTYRGLI